MKALGSAIYAGGFTLGVARHFDVLAHLEETNYGVATVKKNFPNLPVHVGVKNWPLNDFVNVPFIFGNPPCSVWSAAGKNAVNKLDWRLDDRINCTKLHFSLLERLKPQTWVWESVQRAFTVGRPVVDELTRRALDLGYSATYLLHNARYLGCGQNRPRFFCVFHRSKFYVITPDWTSERTAGEVLRKMNDVGPLDMRLSPKIEALFPRLKAGQGLSKLWEEENPPETRVINRHGKVTGRPPFTYHRLHVDRPSNTIAGFNLIHPTEDRCLTTHEMATLNGFPADYEFVGSGIANQIARGVCPPVAEWLARCVKLSLERDEPNDYDVAVVDVGKPPGTRTVLGRPGPVPSLPIQIEEPRIAESEQVSEQTGLLRRFNKWMRG